MHFCVYFLNGRSGMIWCQEPDPNSYSSYQVSVVNYQMKVHWVSHNTEGSYECKPIKTLFLLWDHTLHSVIYTQRLFTLGKKREANDFCLNCAVKEIPSNSVILHAFNLAQCHLPASIAPSGQVLKNDFILSKMITFMENPNGCLKTKQKQNKRSKRQFNSATVNLIFKT